MSDKILGLLFATGLILIFGGLWLAYPPLAMIASGLSLALLSVGLEKQVGRKGNGAPRQ